MYKFSTLYYSKKEFMIDNLNLSNVLFLDIETVPACPQYADLNDRMKEFWDTRAARIKSSDNETPEETYNKAAIFAEFGKVICISAGMIQDAQVKIRSYAAHDEASLLKEFAEVLTRFGTNPSNRLCAHNGKEFDFPYLCRRMLINGIKIPSIINSQGKKPWEVNHVDTMELWKFGDYKHYTALDLLAELFDIPSPKDDIKGSDVHKVYWQDGDLARIVKYCQKDVITIIQLMRRFQGLPLISEVDISFA